MRKMSNVGDMPMGDERDTMAGNGAAGDQPMMARGLQAEGSESAEPESNVSPEEQQQYDETVSNAMRLLYGNEGGANSPAMKATLQSLAAGDDRVEALALTTVTVMKRVVDSAAQAGAKIPGDVLIHAGAEVLEDLAGVAGKAKIHEFTEDELERAGYRAMDLFRAASGDQIDGAAVQEDMQSLMKADQSGELDRAVPGLREHFAGMGEQRGGGGGGGAMMPAGRAPAAPEMARGLGRRAA